MKIKIDLNFEMYDLTNTSIGFANKLLAGLLMSELKGDSVKLFDWAMELSSKGIIEIDEADLIKLTELVSTSERMQVMGKAPIVKHLQKLKK
jgi:hypothetical protein